MASVKLLFLHGARGYAEDQVIADGLGSVLGIDVDFPELPDEDMSYESWAGVIRERLRAMGSRDIVVAHSFGASILLRVLAEEAREFPTRATLLAMPDWSPNGWGVADYAFTGPEPDVHLSLHHCRDDEVVEFDHLALNARALPSARLTEHVAGGHQFEGLTDTIASDILAH